MSELTIDEVSQALITDRPLLQKLYLTGQLDRLDESQRRLLTYPELHPGLPDVDVRYPLSLQDISILTGIKEADVSSLVSDGKVTSYIVNGHVVFARASAVQLMLFSNGKGSLGYE